MKKNRHHTAPSRLAIRAAALVASAGLAGSAANAQVVDWVQPGTGFWNAGGNWSGGTSPNSQTVIARVLNGGVAEVNGSFSVGGLQIGAGSGVRILNSRSLSLYGNVDNDGFLELAGTGNNTVLNIESDLTFAGTGEFRYVGGNSTTVNRITGTFSANNTLTNASEHTIRAFDFANLGFNSININNQGLIVADGSGTTGGEFLVNARGGAGVNLTNTGTMRAENGGTLTITGSGGGAFDNTGGLIEALDASTVRFISGANITGGTLQTQGSGEFLVSSSAAIADVVNDATLRVLNASTLTAAGTIENLRSITLDGDGNNTVFSLSDDLTLTGPGEFRYIGGRNTSVNRIDGSFANDSTLTNAAGHTIRAFDSGNLGFGTINIDNHGLIVADGSGATAGEFVIDGRGVGTSVVNTGTLRAENGGTLTLSGAGTGAFDNTSGLIEALDASTVRLISGANITGGTLRSVGSGEIRASSTAAISDLINDSNFRITNNTSLTATGTIENLGSITLDNTGNSTVINLGGDLLLTGPGEIRYVGGSTTSVNRIAGAFAADSTLTNSADHTIRAFDSGDLGFGTINIDNQGLIVADGSGATPGELVVNGRSSSGVTVINTGTMRAENGGTLALSGAGGGQFDNAGGLIEALDASTVRLISSANVTGGTLRSVGSGEIRASSTAAISDLINDSNFRITNNTSLTATGTIENLGSIILNSTGNNTVINLGGDLLLAGPGEIRYVGGSTTSVNRITGSFSGDNTLTNSADHTIRAFDSGNLGFGGINIDNQGLIVADGSGATPGEFVVNGRSSSGVTVANTGTMRAENGGTLTLSGSGGGQFDNTGGLIEATSAGTVARFSNPTIINFDAPARTLNAGAWTTNDGTLNVAPANFDLEISNADVTIRGAAAATNLFDDASSSPGDIRSLRFRENNGAFTVADGASFTTTLDGFSTFESTGVFTVGAGSTVTITGDADTLNNQAGGLFTGAGTLNAHLDSAGGVRTDALATLAITGSAMLAGDFIVGLGSNSGLLQVGGDLGLGGSIFIDVIDDALLSHGAEYLIATTAADLSGDFTALATNSALYEFETFLDFDAGTVTLRAAFIPAPGSAALLMVAGLAAARRRRG